MLKRGPLVVEKTPRMWLHWVFILIVGCQTFVAGKVSRDGNFPTYTRSCCSREFAQEMLASWAGWRGTLLSSKHYITIMKQVFACVDRRSPKSAHVLERLGLPDMEGPQLNALAWRFLTNLDIMMNLIADGDGETLDEFAKHLAKMVTKRGGDLHQHNHFPACYTEVLSKAISCFNPRAWFSCQSEIDDRITSFASLAPFDKGQVLGNVTNSDIVEASGIASSRRHPDVLYTMNDSGAGATIYAISAVNGDVLATYQVLNASNCDWEDIAVGTGPDGSSYIYVGDIGGNTPSVCNIIYRIREPEILSDSNLAVDSELKYTWDEGNCETLMADSDHQLYIVSKVMPGETPRLYRLPDWAWGATGRVHLTGGTPVRVTSLQRFMGPVAGDISVDGKQILIKTYNNIFYWKRDLKDSLAKVLQREPQILPYTRERQGESVGWNIQGTGFYTLGEGKSQSLWYYAKE